MHHSGAKCSSERRAREQLGAALRAAAIARGGARASRSASTARSRRFQSFLKASKLWSQSGQVTASPRWRAVVARRRAASARRLTRRPAPRPAGRARPRLGVRSKAAANSVVDRGAERRASSGAPCASRCDRGHAHAVEAAGDDPGERLEVVVDVDREAVRRHAARDVDADRRDLALRGPDARVVRRRRRVARGRRCRRRPRAPRTIACSIVRRYAMTSTIRMIG